MSTRVKRKELETLVDEAPRTKRQKVEEETQKRHATIDKHMPKIFKLIDEILRTSACDEEEGCTIVMYDDCYIGLLDSNIDVETTSFSSLKVYNERLSLGNIFRNEEEYFTKLIQQEYDFCTKIVCGGIKRYEMKFSWKKEQSAEQQSPTTAP